MIVGTLTHLWIAKCVNETMHDIWNLLKSIICRSLAVDLGTTPFLKSLISYLPQRTQLVVPPIGVKITINLPCIVQVPPNSIIFCFVFNVVIFTYAN